MDEKLRESLAAMIDFLTESMTAGMDLAGEQIPLFIQEILQWGIAERVLWMFIGIAIGTAFLCVGRNIFSMISHRESFDATRGPDEEFTWVLGKYMLPWVGYIIWFFSISVNVFGMAKILVAPRLYLLEVVSGLLK